MHLRNNNSGVVMFISIIVVIMAMIFSIAILSQSLSQNQYSRNQVDRIKAEQMAKGIFTNAYINNSLVPGTYQLGQIGGSSRTYTAVVRNTGAGPGATQAYSVNVTY